MMKSIGIIDLGSNNARMVVYEYEPRRWFRLVDDIREPVRLGEGLGKAGALTAAAIARGVAALDLFADYAAASGLDRLETIGTSALRDASNTAEFRRAVAHRGIHIRVLSGEDEASRGVLAVANGFDLEAAWVMDLGGGSAQVSRMEGRELVAGKAYPLGAVRLTEAFLPSELPKRSTMRQLEVWVEKHLGRLAKTMRRDPRLPLVAMGGTIRNLAHAAQKKSGYPLALLHGYFLTRADLEAVTDELLRQPARARARVPGINSDRADVILAGALVYRWLLRAAGKKGLLISGHGVREGTFYRHFLSRPYLLKNVRAGSIANLEARYGLASPHVRHVRQLARQLFDGLAPLHRLGAPEAELLDAAAALHDIGVAVDFYRHHRHGAYILGSDALPGFTHREQALLMLLVRFHHGGAIRPSPYESLVEAGDKRLLSRLAACLAVAESLERSRSGRVSGLRVEIDGGTVRLHLSTREEPVVELWETTKHAALFELAYGKRLELKTAQPR